MNSRHQDTTPPPAIEVPMLYMVDTGVPPVFDQSASAAERPGILLGCGGDCLLG